ncbi:MAG TPA: hypothetical protein VFX15_00180 [Actinomycetes bacterium]|nr:hypothetical protein [Actinomycetes bacterium]
MIATDIERLEAVLAIIGGGFIITVIWEEWRRYMRRKEANERQREISHWRHHRRPK